MSLDGYCPDPGKKVQRRANILNRDLLEANISVVRRQQVMGVRMFDGRMMRLRAY